MGNDVNPIMQALKTFGLFAAYTPKALWCYTYPTSATIEPGMCQADIPHLVYHKLKLTDHKLKCEEKCQESCPAPVVDQYFLNPGELSKCTKAFFSPAPVGPPDIKFAPFCEFPLPINSAPHRALARISHSGEYFAVAFEEARIPFTENVFIAAFTKKGKEKLAKKSDDDIRALISAAIFVKTGVILDRDEHLFKIFRKDNAEKLLAQGCKASKHMWKL